MQQCILDFISIFLHMERKKQMQKEVFIYLIIIILLILTGCASSSSNRGHGEQFGFWATTSQSFSKRKPSIWKCAWGEESQYHNKNCN